MNQPFNTDAYRYPNESLILTGTLLLVGAVIAATAVATVCGSVVFVGLALLLSYSATRSHHAGLMRQAMRITPERAPELARLAQACSDRLQPGNIELYVAGQKELNAYTFGMSDPKVVVVYAGLFEVMDSQEITFIFGHEMGHVRLGHTRLNSLLGGLAGIPAASAATAVLALAFLAWNRACEHSADRAGMLACGQPEKAITALIKLAAGPEALSREGMERAYQQLDAQDDTWLGSMGEALGTHPLIIRRIEAIRKYARTKEYARLREEMGKNEERS